MIKKLSVIIPCYNRLDELEELFPSLEKQNLNFSKFEIIVVDDGSSDDSEKYVLNYIKKTKLNMSYLRQQNEGPGAARNLGMKNAQGDFFVFVDSDVISPNHWLQTIFDGINANGYTAFGAPDRAHKSFSATLKAIDYAMTSFITTGGLRGREGRNLAKFFPRSFNMGLSRSVFEKIGEFGLLRHGQDIEYSNRIIKSGAKVGFIPNAYVYHKRRTSLKKFFKQAFNWGVARINLYKIDSNMLELLHCLPAIATFFIFSMIILGFINSTILQINQMILYFMVLLFFFSSLHALFKYRNVTTSLLVPITMSIQIFAYGMGFIYAYFSRIIFSGTELKGFSKNYYK